MNPARRKRRWTIPPKTNDCLAQTKNHVTATLSTTYRCIHHAPLLFLWLPFEDRRHRRRIHRRSSENPSSSTRRIIMWRRPASGFCATESLTVCLSSAHFLNHRATPTRTNRKAKQKTTHQRTVESIHPKSIHPKSIHQNSDKIDHTLFFFFHQCLLLHEHC